MSKKKIADYIMKHMTGFSFSKAFITIASIVTLLIGLLFIGAGGLSISQSQDIAIGSTTSLAIAAIVLGVFTIGIATLGFIGATQEKTSFLKTFAALYALVLLIEIIVGAVAYSGASNVAVTAHNSWDYLATSPHNATLISFETEYTCCGFANVTDYAVPQNCSAVYGYTKGCATSFTEVHEKGLLMLGGAGLVAGLFQVVILCLAVYVINTIKKNGLGLGLSRGFRSL